VTQEENDHESQKCYPKESGPESLYRGEHHGRAAAHDQLPIVASVFMLKESTPTGGVENAVAARPLHHFESLALA
jgi:hypothetical protein